MKSSMQFTSGRGRRKRTLKVEMEPHEFMIMNESGDGTAMDITLNNYRVNKDEIILIINSA